MGGHARGRVPRGQADGPSLSSGFLGNDDEREHELIPPHRPLQNFKAPVEPPPPVAPRNDSPGPGFGALGPLPQHGLAPGGQPMFVRGVMPPPMSMHGRPPRGFLG